MDYCWWHKGKRHGGKPTAHVVAYSIKIFGVRIYSAYCGKKTIFNHRKDYGKVEQAVKDGGEICWECWNKLPRSLLMKITHLPYHDNS